MTPVDPWVEIGAKAIASHRDQRGGGWERDEDVWHNYTIFAEWVIGAVESLIRADEKEKIAQAIETERDRYLRNEPDVLNGNKSGATFYTDAARIARGEGQSKP